MSTTSILVCVTQQKTCERLIREGNRLAANTKGLLYVIHVSRKDLNFLDITSEGEALQYLFDVSNAAGASLTVLKSDNVINAIVRYAKENTVTDLVLGSSPDGGSENKFAIELKKALQGVRFHIVMP